MIRILLQLIIVSLALASIGMAADPTGPRAGELKSLIHQVDAMDAKKKAEAKPDPAKAADAPKTDDKKVADKTVADAKKE